MIDNIFHPSHVEEHVIRMFLARFQKAAPDANLRRKFMLFAVIPLGLTILLVLTIFAFAPNSLIPLLLFGISAIFLWAIRGQIRKDRSLLEKIVAKTQDAPWDEKAVKMRVVGYSAFLFGPLYLTMVFLPDEVERTILTVLFVLLAILLLAIFSAVSTATLYRIYLIKKYCPYLTTLEDRRYVKELPKVIK